MISAGESANVDVIIPVYRGLDETRRCLESVLAFPQQTPHEVIVINDCSPEPELTAYLRQLAGTGVITLLENPVNLGFVNTVNHGMILHPDRDVVLLNSDAEVHGDWLDRLRRHAESSPNIGTVTPFSNNATICSYPRFVQDNPLPEGWPLAALDTLFAQVNAGQTVDIPTAVGFCMYITRRCLNQVGYFDASLFGRGYGEENDFSMRALEIGFRNLLAADTLVYHRGGVSFGAEGSAQCAAAQRILEQRHPRYFPLVADHCARDPARLARRRVDVARLARSSRPRLLFIMHQGGGGTEKHLRELALLLEPDYEVFILRAHDSAISAIAVLEWARRGEEFSAWLPMPQAYPDLLALLRELRLTRIHFHHVLDLHQQLLRLPADLGVPYDFTLHDYYSICPQYNLADADGRYCGEPDTAGCNACLAERPAPWGLDIQSWRNWFRPLLMQAERVIAPSQDLLERMRRYLPDAPYVHLPHPEIMGLNAPPPTLPRPIRELKIVVLGGLTPAKGLYVVEACALDAQQRGLPLYFRVIGHHGGRPVRQEPDAPLSFSGVYDDEQLPLLIDRERPDAIFFPAQWPETYSYTLSAALRTGLPIFAPRLGAFSERLADYPPASLLAWDSPAAAWNDQFMALWCAEHPQSASGIVHDMTPEDYLRKYTAPFQPAETLPHPRQDEAALMLARGYYYPPYLKLETYLDVLNLSELQHVVQDLLAVDGTQQRLTRRDAIKHQQSVQHLNQSAQRIKDEWEQQRLEISRLNVELANFAEKAPQQAIALEQLQATAAQLAADNAVLRKTVAEICASTSWKATAPLRRLMQAIRALRTPV